MEETSYYLPMMIICTEIPKETMSKLLELIRGFSKMAGYRINTQKLSAIIYISTKKLENAI